MPPMTYHARRSGTVGVVGVETKLSYYSGGAKDDLNLLARLANDPTKNVDLRDKIRKYLSLRANPKT